MRFGEIVFAIESSRPRQKAKTPETLLIIDILFNLVIL